MSDITRTLSATKQSNSKSYGPVAKSTKTKTKEQ